MDMPSTEEAEGDYAGVGQSITHAEVTKIVKAPWW